MQVSRLFMAPTSVWFDEETPRFTFQSGWDRIEILLRPKDDVLTLCRLYIQ